MVQLLVEAEDKLESVSDPFKACEMYIDKYHPKEIAYIRALSNESQKDLEGRKFIIKVFKIIDHCQHDDYLKFENSQISLTSKGRKFADIEYFVITLAKEIGPVWSILTSLGIGALIGKLIS